MKATSQILYGEVAASFARKRREQPADAAVLDQAQQTFRSDWAGLHRVDVDDEVRRGQPPRRRAVSRHPLRGADAIHLASALVLRDLAKDQVTFACADVALVGATRAEGLAIAD